MFSVKASGFTLIELLVVISIIGVLASIVLVATNGGRTKANDASVKGDMRSTANQVELYYAVNGNYGEVFRSAVCPTASNPPDPLFYTDAKIISMISTLNGIDGNLTKCAAGSTANSGTATSWAVAAPVSYTTQYWCMDSTGSVKLSDNDAPWWMNVLAYITPEAVAGVLVTPDIGGGYPVSGGGPAFCP